MILIEYRQLTGVVFVVENDVARMAVEIGDENVKQQDTSALMRQFLKTCLGVCIVGCRIEAEVQRSKHHLF